MSVVVEVVDIESLEVTSSVVVFFKDVPIEIIIRNCLVVLVLTPLFPLKVIFVDVVVFKEVFSIERVKLYTTVLS